MVALSIPRSRDAVSCDLIELNHVYGRDGKLKYSQVMMLDWSPDYRRFDVHAWVSIEGLRHQPHKYAGGWRMETLAGVVIRADMFRETFTTTDPERNQAKLFPSRYRRQFLCER